MKYQKHYNNYLVSFAACAVLSIWAPSSSSGAMGDYCSAPPFISNTVPPNVLIVLDNSLSMNDWAYANSYDPTRYIAGDSTHPGYYGYFDPGSTYQYNGTVWNKYTGTPPDTVDAGHPTAMGDFLNWATMRRIDVAKKLMMGGKSLPTSPNPGDTVALLGETAPTPSWDFVKSDSGGRMSPFSSGISYDYEMRGDRLYVRPNTGNLTRLPKTNYNTNWTNYGQSTQYRTVDDKTINEDIDYIYNQTNTSSQLFGYTAFTTPTDIPTGSTIQSVSVTLRAKKTASGTNRIKGVIVVGGTEYQHTNYSNLSTSWETYEFEWTANPKTGLAWTIDDLTNAASVNYLSAFGVYDVTMPTSSAYQKVTWIELSVSLSAPSGGPYTIKVNWRYDDWSMKNGILYNLGNEARFGLAFYNGAIGDNDGGYISTYVNFEQPTNMITTIQNLTPSTYTPLAETLFEMVRYFRQDPPKYRSQDFTVDDFNYKDPYYFDYPTGSSFTDQYVPCAKSYILLLTDGEPTYDLNIPTTETGVPTGKNLQDYDEDGKDPGNYPLNGSDYLDDVALWARTVDTRPGACSGTVQSAWTQPCIPGTQNIYVYSVFMFGKGSQLLKDAAKNGGFNDLDGNGLPGPGLNEYLRDSNEDGSITSSDLPLTYFEGDDGYELQTSITEAITSILRRAASGTAVSVLTTSSRGVGSMIQAYFLPVRQEGTREVTWTGYAQNLWLDDKDNLREDTVSDKKLILNDDRVIKLYFDSLNSETRAASFTTDVDGNSDPLDPGSLESCDPLETEKFTEISPIWEGGKKLALTRPSGRTKLFTSKKVINGTSTTHNFTNYDFTVSNITSNGTFTAALNGDATYSAENIVRYIRGQCLETGATTDDALCGSTANATYRDRRITVSGGDTNGNVWKLGDVITSTPQVLGTMPVNLYHRYYDDETYSDFIESDSYIKRSSVAFIGANDGMLHAFRVGYLKEETDSYGTLASNVKALFKNFFTDTDTTNDKVSEEIWGYIPFNAFPYLKYLADPNYCHIYYNDLTINMQDVSLGCSNDSSCDDPTETRVYDATKSSWRTVIIGGMRYGGACSSGISPTGPPSGTPANVGFSSFYAIDITDTANPVPLWEFSEADLGYATSYPAVLRTGNSGTNGYWYVAIGSGSKQLPNKEGTSQTIDRTSTGYIYILNLKTGELVKKITLDHNAIVGDIISVDADKDYKSEKIYFGTAYRDGTTWKGKLASIDIPNQDLSQTWNPTPNYLFADSFPFTASPDAVKDENRKTWVYIGSGKYDSDLDEAETAGQVFLGLKDDSIVSTLSKTFLDDRTNTNTTGTVTGTTTMCMFDSTTNNFGAKTLATSINTTSAAVPPSTRGWYVSLSTSPTVERVISKPLAIGGLVDFLSYKPTHEPCSSGGDTYLYSLGYTTGVAPENISILHPDMTGGATSGEVTVAKGIRLGPGSPPRGESIVIPPVKEGDDEDPDRPPKMIQVGTGAILQVKNETAYSVISQIVHWMKK